MKEKQLEQAFEALFGISYDTGREDVRYLIEKAQRMGNFAEGHKINWGGKTTLDDRDFLKIAFFAIIGAGFVEEILGTTAELPDGKTKSLGTRIPCGHCKNDRPDAPPCLACDGRGYFEAKPYPPDDDGSAGRAGEYADPRTHKLEPYRNLEVRHRGPFDEDDVAMRNDPRRPEILMRCGTCCKDMGQVNGVDWVCINSSCHEYHQAIEIGLG